MENKIVAVRYLAENREVELKFLNGARLSCPVDTLEILSWTGSEFVKAPCPTDEQLANVRVWAGGYAIDFPEIEQNFDIDELTAMLPIGRSTEAAA